MGESEIDIAIKAFEESRVNTAPTDLYHYNMAVGLLALSRAVKEMEEVLQSTRLRLGNVEKELKND
jgi:hypothetical protein